MEKAYSAGKMVQGMKANGKKIKLMGLGNFCMLMETFMKENGKMIRHMDKVGILECREQRMKELGRMIYSMAMGLKFGLMELDLKETSTKG